MELDNSLVDFRDYPIYCIRAALKDQPEYTTTIGLNSLQVRARIGYNIVNKKRWIILETLSGDLLLKQTMLSKNRRIFPNANAKILGYDFYLVLIPYKQNETSTDYLNWSDTYNLTFIINDYELTDIIEKDIVKCRMM